MPTYAYEYDQAVKDGYLIDYHNISTSTNFMERGIKYDELSDEEKEEYDNLFEEGEAPDEIDASAINTWLFNRDTIKKLLVLLMEKGLKVEEGDKLGKTIIFARRHEHAQKIVDVFNELYPRYKGEFAKVIDNRIEYHEDLIDKFSQKDQLPQIAVSVDMLDTGVDIPEILNLVFFKPVKSKIKFWQMIGRGTRLCKDLFGIGNDKKEFYIFDYCRNFEFFSVNPKGTNTSSKISLTEKIFSYKLDLIVKLQEMKYNEQEKFVRYRDELVDEFIEKILELNKDSFIIKNKLYYVEKYSNKENWNYLSILDKTNIKENILPILLSSEENEDAKKFDSLLYCLQLKKINNKETDKLQENISILVAELEKLTRISIVNNKKELIVKVAEKDYLNSADFFQIEKVRKELRDLIQYIDPCKWPIKYTDFQDTVLNIDEDYKVLSNNGNYDSYKKKVIKYFSNNLNNIIVWKIRHNVKINESEKKELEKIFFNKLGTNKEFNNVYGDKSVTEVVRNIVGLDPDTASEIFSKYINYSNLNVKQIQFVKMLIDYVIRNGTIDMIVLTEEPFRSLGEIADLFEGKENIFIEMRKDIENINKNVKKLG